MPVRYSLTVNPCLIPVSGLLPECVSLALFTDGIGANGMLYGKQNSGARHEQFSTRFGWQMKIWLSAKNHRDLRCNARSDVLQSSKFLRADASDSQLERHFYKNRQVRLISNLDGVDLIPRIAPCSANDVTAGSSAWKENGCSTTNEQR